MKRSKKIQFLSLGAAFIMLSGIVATRIQINKNVKLEPEEEAIEEVIEEPEIIRYKPYYSNDTVDIDESINNLGIVSDNNYPYKLYKFIRFVDFENHERFAIVNVYVDYDFDKNGELNNTIYTYCDAFTGKVLLTTNDFRKINDFNSDTVWLIMEYGDLLDLRSSVISKGLDEEYAYGVMSDDINNKTLSTYDVARMYVLLVNSSNRYEKVNQMKLG